MNYTVLIFILCISDIGFAFAEPTLITYSDPVTPSEIIPEQGIQDPENQTNISGSTDRNMITTENKTEDQNNHSLSSSSPIPVDHSPEISLKNISQSSKYPQYLPEKSVRPCLFGKSGCKGELAQ